MIYNALAMIPDSLSSMINRINDPCGMAVVRCGQASSPYWFSFVKRCYANDERLQATVRDWWQQNFGLDMSAGWRGKPAPAKL